MDYAAPSVEHQAREAAQRIGREAGLKPQQQEILEAILVATIKGSTATGEWIQRHVEAPTNQGEQISHGCIRTQIYHIRKLLGIVAGPVWIKTERYKNDVSYRILGWQASAKPAASIKKGKIKWERYINAEGQDVIKPCL